MEEKIIEKKKVPDLLRKLGEEYRVFIPQKRDGEVRFSQLDSTHDICWDYQNSKISPKEILFPQMEPICQFRGGEISEVTAPDEKSIIFGIRPCDALAIKFLDRLFCEGEFKDPYYSKKRSGSLIIASACIHPQTTCFCTSLKGKPDGEEGADIVIFDLGEELLVRPVTKKGQEFIEGQGKWFRQAKKSDVEKKNKLMGESRKKINAQINVNGIKEKLGEGFDASLWEELHQKCLGCGICSYLCPTCHCFDMTDETAGDEGKRMRCWDSCMFPLFTLHASGHNPRPSYKERMRQRIMHKFNYCPENFEEIFCVGCGRCITNCPVNIDIREVIRLANG